MRWPRFRRRAMGSTGGREGLTGALRFPEAFDGIISNYPTANFMGLRLWGAVLAHAVYDNNSAGWITPTMVNKIASDTLGACDTLDGAADALVSNMAACRGISPAYRAAITCQNGETGYPPNCLTQAQLGTIAVYHEGYSLPYSLANNISDYTGYNALEGITMELGSQAAYTNPVIDNVNAHHVARADQFVKYFVTRDPNRHALMHGLRYLVSRQARTLWLALYGMDFRTESSRSKFLDKVRQRLQRF